ncbi:MAG: BrnA antitoxin family protein [Rhizobiaceae bacterium]|nr:BrnA antitoxin family protein [Rhizobiaceae bacterium]
MTNISQARLKELAARRDDQIDYSDIPELGADFWKNARIVEPATTKQQLTIRIDTDVLDWFRARGKGYQSRMNAVLRAYVDAQDR